ncbi:hypothetical protein [Pseudodesulfovibrio sp. zrk46]|uniref:hypothetical protein n=1 Tax=Pseudodesulfovibrio sp. zrk46 TaxID=2725288 RepID=UPI00144995E2|nr:hypothetical protein [Pseudodesulfovibrio sp. zrk46]QJB55834.1 hypothetical protein HFN16_05180 [Pseudodesulfovibrio sp. zrk46]
MRITIPKVHGESPKEKAIRSIALLLVFAAVIWAFTKNNERVVERLNQEAAVYDETKTLDKAQKKFIISFTRSLKSEFGMDSKIQIYGGDFVVPDLDSKTLYIGLAPAIDVVEIRFPPMMRQALGDDFIKQITEENFLPSFKYNDWPQEIQVVLVRIYDKLTQLNEGKTPVEQ